MMTHKMTQYVIWNDEMWDSPRFYLLILGSKESSYWGYNTM